MYTFIEKETGRIVTDPDIVEYYTYAAQAMGVPYNTKLIVNFKSYNEMEE